MEFRSGLKTRREFLRSTVLGGALSWTVPAFVNETFSVLHAAADGAAVQPVTGKDGPILVVLQLAGGNDGLNTIIPIENDHYFKARPKLAISKKEALGLSDGMAFHPALAPVTRWFDRGQLAVVNGVGYPNPNRSHFRSMEIWHTAADSDEVLASGWLGRFFDAKCAGCDPSVGVAVGDQAPQAFTAKLPTGIALRNPGQFRYRAGGGPRNELAVAQESVFREMHGFEESDDAVAGETVGGLVASVSSEMSPVDFLERTALNAQLSSDKILEIAQRVPGSSGYPKSRLANDLHLVSRLIAGGLDSRVYYVSQGGYDTHVGQKGAHPRLLGELAQALDAFLGDLKAIGELERVVVLAFSEFGRRVAENASGGTDHGAAAPAFLLGGPIQGGLFGTYPSLAPRDLVRGDLAHAIDFRSLYATVLERWLKAPSGAVLGRSFPLIEGVL